MNIGAKNESAMLILIALLVFNIKRNKKPLEY